MRLEYVYLLLIAVAIVMVVLAYRAYKVYASVGKFSEFWKLQAERSPRKGAIKVLALGDSVMQGVGASTIKNTFASLVEGHVQKISGRDVFLKNVSVTGATVRRVVEDQLPQVNPNDFDMILLIASANDAFKDVPEDTFRQDLAMLLSLLPSEKVLMADVPWVKRRSRYVPILHDVAKRYGFTVISHDIDTAKSRLPFVYVAGDFLHPSDRGYRDIWFSNFRPEIDKMIERLTR
jgi:acyl-CoA thioesterase-1